MEGRRGSIPESPRDRRIPWVRGHSRREQLGNPPQNLKLTWQVARTTIYTDPALCRAALGGGWNSPATNADRSKNTSWRLTVFPRTTGNLKRSRHACKNFEFASKPRLANFRPHICGPTNLRCRFIGVNRDDGVEAPSIDSCTQTFAHYDYFLRERACVRHNY
jgi:hypothetical protein